MNVIPAGAPARSEGRNRNPYVVDILSKEDMMTQSIRLKRAYDPPDKDDGFRVLVDRLWPRGLKKEDLAVDLWLKDIAPSDMLRKWYSHDPERWEEFKSHYFEELRENDEAVDRLLKASGGNKVITLVYSSKEEKLNNAVALKEYIEKEKFQARKAA